MENQRTGRKLKEMEKGPYITGYTDALKDALQADILLQRAKCHAIQAEGKQQDACYR